MNIETIAENLRNTIKGKAKKDYSGFVIRVKEVA